MLKGIFIGIALILTIWVGYYSYHFMLKIAEAVGFPKENAIEMFWLAVVASILYQIAKALD